jgi:hypothetical protein
VTCSFFSQATAKKKYCDIGDEVSAGGRENGPRDFAGRSTPPYSVSIEFVETELASYHRPEDGLLSFRELR